jgi:ribosomal protein L37AE/L43A
MSGWPDRQRTADVEPQVSRPVACEACGSSAVSTGSKTIDANTYFNCGKCGHVWHPGRSRDRDDRHRRWR